MSHKNRERIRGAIQAAFEAMETRRLMSAVQVTDGVLIVDADPHTASNIIVDLHAPSGRITGYANGVKATFSADEVRAILVNGGEGDDSIFIDPALNLPTLIKGGAGDDWVRGGSGVDTIDAGPGNDTVHGGRGDDRISGGEGHDLINGNAGDDLLDGGLGEDRLYGQDGDDTIYGGEGFDLLAGQGGDDTIYGGEGDDRVSGNTGDDEIFGGLGDDAIEGNRGADQLVGGEGVDKVRGGGGKNSVVPDGDNGATPPPDLTESPEVTVPPAVEAPAPAPIQEPAPAPAPPPVNDSPTPDGGTDAETPDQGPAPKPVIRMIGDADLVAGGTVHVHGLESALNDGTLLNTTFEWNFGDPSGRYNELKGFNAAHVYDKPGVYTISLTVTSERGAKAVATLNVNVAADERPTVYVDSAKGDDGNDGSSASKAVKTAKRAFELAGDDTRVLFKRGQRYTIDSAIVINEDRVMVGAYGSGSLPVLYRVEGSGDGMFRTAPEAEDVTFKNLRFDSEYKADSDGAAPKIPVTAVLAGGTNITVRDVEFGNVGNAVNSNQKPTGLLVMDSEATKDYGTRSYFVWGQGTDLVILGNTSMDSSREHNVRTSGVERILVAHNNFAQTDRSEDDPGDIQKGCIEIHRGLYSYVTGNTVHGGVIRGGPRGVGEEPTSETAWLVIEDNYCDDVGIQLYPGTHHASIRNNVIERYDSLRHGPAIAFMDSSKGNDRVSGDIYVLNNTAIERRASGSFLKLNTEMQPGSVTVKNNLWVNANFRAGHLASSGIYVSEDNLKSFREITGNVWATPRSFTKWAGNGTNYVGAAWGRQGSYKSAAEWNKMDKVGTDIFTNDVDLGNDVYQVTLKGTTAGASLKLAA
jgi:PKD repeat protein